MSVHLSTTATGHSRSGFPVVNRHFGIKLREKENERHEHILWQIRTATRDGTAGGAAAGSGSGRRRRGGHDARDKAALTSHLQGTRTRARTTRTLDNELHPMYLAKTLDLKRFLRLQESERVKQEDNLGLLKRLTEIHTRRPRPGSGAPGAEPTASSMPDFQHPNRTRRRLASLRIHHENLGLAKRILAAKSSVKGSVNWDAHRAAHQTYLARLTQHPRLGNSQSYVPERAHTKYTPGATAPTPNALALDVAMARDYLARAHSKAETARHAHEHARFAPPAFSRGAGGGARDDSSVAYGRGGFSSGDDTDGTTTSGGRGGTADWLDLAIASAADPRFSSYTYSFPASPHPRQPRAQAPPRPVTAADSYAVAHNISAHQLVHRGLGGGVRALRGPHAEARLRRRRQAHSAGSGTDTSGTDGRRRRRRATTGGAGAAGADGGADDSLYSLSSDDGDERKRASGEPDEDALLFGAALEPPGPSDDDWMRGPTFVHPTRLRGAGAPAAAAGAGAGRPTPAVVPAPIPPPPPHSHGMRALPDPDAWGVHKPHDRLLTIHHPFYTAPFSSVSTGTNGGHSGSTGAMGIEHAMASAHKRHPQYHGSGGTGAESPRTGANAAAADGLARAERDGVHHAVVVPPSTRLVSASPMPYPPPQPQPLRSPNGGYVGPHYASYDGRPRPPQRHYAEQKTNGSAAGGSPAGNNPHLLRSNYLPPQTYNFYAPPPPPPANPAGAAVVHAVAPEYTREPLPEGAAGPAAAVAVVMAAHAADTPFGGSGAGLAVHAPRHNYPVLPYGAAVGGSPGFTPRPPGTGPGGSGTRGNSGRSTSKRMSLRR